MASLTAPQVQMETDERAPPLPLLELDQIRVHGTLGFELGPISAVLAPGEALGLVGQTGAGKSLLLRSIAGLSPLLAGHLHWPRLHADARAAHKRPRIGLAFQRDALLANEDALENVALAARGLGLSTPQERAWQILRDFDLQGAAHKFPAELSGGMRRRVGLARALVVAPHLLLCDDTTAGLDPATEAEILEHIFSYLTQTNAALIFATHSLDAVLPSMRRVGILVEGKLAFVGSPSTLATNKTWAAFAPLVSVRSDAQ